SPYWSGLPQFLVAMAVLVVAWLVATPLTIRHARKVQKTGWFMIGGLKEIGERGDPTSQLTEKDISPHFWPNHHLLPNSAEYPALLLAALPTIACASAGSWRIRRNFRMPTSRQCRSRARSPPISASRAGRGWQNGAAFRC